MPLFIDEILAAVKRTCQYCGEALCKDCGKCQTDDCPTVKHCTCEDEE